MTENKSKNDNLINCDVHGKQPATYVCQHIVEGLNSKKRVGFFWAQAPDNPQPDAWCSECEKRVQLTNGEWVGEASENLGVKVLCANCYDLAKSFHMGGNPWS